MGSFIGAQEPYLNVWSVVITLASDVVLLGTLVALIYQISSQRKEQEEQLRYRKADLRVQTSANLHPFILEMFRDPDSARIWGVGRKSHLDLNEMEQEQFKWACVYWFEHIAAIHLLAHEKMIDEKDLAGWQRAIVDDFRGSQRKPGLIHWWHELQEDYEEEFRTWIAEQVGEDMRCDCGAHAVSK